MLQSPNAPLTSSSTWIALQCHSASSAGEVTSIEVRHHRIASLLTLHYRITGDISSLRIPPAQVATRCDELWRHTCMEVFFAPCGSAAYCEYNFSPSSYWAAYQFSGYREGMGPLSCKSPVIEVSNESRQLLLSATVNLPVVFATSSLQTGWCAVIEDCEGACSYWALQHDTVHPDFHRSENWVQCV